MASVVYDGNLLPNITNLSAASMSTTIANHGNGRYMLWLQWALRQTGEYTDPVDGHYRASVQTSLDAVRASSYDDGHGTYAPLTGPTVSRTFLAAFFADYLDTPDTKNIVA